MSVKLTGHREETTNGIQFSQDPQRTSAGLWSPASTRVLTHLLDRPSAVDLRGHQLHGMDYFRQFMTEKSCQLLHIVSDIHIKLYILWQASHVSETLKYEKIQLTKHSVFNSQIGNILMPFINCLYSFAVLCFSGVQQMPQTCNI